jgi:hypothetical protein
LKWFRGTAAPSAARNVSKTKFVKKSAVSIPQRPPDHGSRELKGRASSATAACALRRSPTVMKKDPGFPSRIFVNPLDKPKIEKGGISHCPNPHVINWNESSAKPRAGGQLAHDLAKVPAFGRDHVGKQRVKKRERSHLKRSWSWMECRHCNFRLIFTLYDCI